MAEMLVDRVEDRMLLSDGSQSRAPAVIGGVERRVEGMGPFGPIRTVHRRYLAESSEALGSARRLREFRGVSTRYARIKTGL